MSQTICVKCGRPWPCPIGIYPHRASRHTSAVTTTPVRLGAASSLTGVVDSWTETTLISALLYYGLACADGTHCVDALRKIGHDKAADVLADALAERNA